ncbi:MAG: hypothetical protein R3C97_12560 [Geminicoccaceae bacterium]
MDGDAGTVLRRARFDAVRRIAQLAAERKACAVLVAGDSFGRAPVEETIHRAIDAMAPYQGLDPPPRQPRPGTGKFTPGTVWKKPARRSIFMSFARRLDQLDEAGLEILTAPLRHRHDPIDPTAWMASSERRPGRVRVGLAHGGVQGFGEDEDHAINRIDPGLVTAAGLDYLALGDWHGTLEISKRCWYSGTPEPDRFRNNDQAMPFWSRSTSRARFPGSSACPRPNFAGSSKRWTMSAKLQHWSSVSRHCFPGLFPPTACYSTSPLPVKSTLPAVPWSTGASRVARRASATFACATGSPTGAERR